MLAQGNSALVQAGITGCGLYVFCNRLTQAFTNLSGELFPRERFLQEIILEVDHMVIDSCYQGSPRAAEGRSGDGAAAMQEPTGPPLLFGMTTSVITR